MIRLSGEEGFSFQSMYFRTFARSSLSQFMFNLSSRQLDLFIVGADIDCSRWQIQINSKIWVQGTRTHRSEAPVADGSVGDCGGDGWKVPETSLLKVGIWDRVRCTVQFTTKSKTRTILTLRTGDSYAGSSWHDILILNRKAFLKLTLFWMSCLIDVRCDIDCHKK